MSHIRNRKHARAGQPLLTQSLIALAALGAPLAAHAQSATAPKDVAMPELSVTATADVPYKADKVQSPKLTQPLVDTTQTISVIRKEVLQEQGASSIVEALRNTPGITLQLGENGNTSAGDTFQMRGFATQSSIFVDGVRDLGPVSRDAFNIEQVEVSKGPAGADIGRGAASGYVNLVTKSAQADHFTSGAASVNSAGNKRVSADLNRTLSATSAFRINAVGQDGGVLKRDRVDQSVLGIAPSVAFGLGTPTRFTLQSQHMRQDNVPDGGIPSIGLPGFYNARAEQRGAPRVRVDNFYGLASDYEKIDADMVTARIEHDLAPGMKLANIARYGSSKMDRILTGVNPITSTATVNGVVVVLPQNQWTVARTRQAVLQENKILANQTSLVADFVAGGLRHTVSTGLELMSEKQVSTGRGGLGSVAAANLYQPNANDPVTALAPVANGVFTRGATTTVAAYLFDTVKLSERFHLNGGVRVEHYDTDTNSAALSTARSHPQLPVGTLVTAPYLEDADKLVSWKLGALYKPAPNGSVYAALATSKTPPGSANFSLSATPGNLAEPNMDAQETRNAEIGTKWDVLAKQLAVTAALYRTENLNEFTLLDAVTNSYAQLGKRRVQGLELGMVGQFTRNWQIIAGLATMKTTVLQGTTGGNAAGADTRWSPDLTATLWSSYKVNDKLTVGGGLRYTSEQKRLVDPSVSAAVTSMPEIPAYTVADAMLGYKVTDKVSVQLNVYNVFDKFYINTLNNGGSRYSLGQQRSAQLSANIAF